LLKFKIAIPPNLVKVGDTLPFFRAVLKPPEIENHKLSTLSKHFEISQETAHDALSDSITLKLICEKYTKNNKIDLAKIFENCTRNIEDYINKQTHNTPLPKLKKP
jgi:DNA polymerase III epsilon subunit-like protein